MSNHGSPGASVGAFPGLGGIHRRVVRAPTNPFDKATVVSIFPRPIVEVKHTIQPGVFKIPSGTVESPGTLVIGSSSWWREIDEDQPVLEIPVYSIQIAESIVTDYCVGLLGYNVGVAAPGMFYVPGEHAPSVILKDFKKELTAASFRQKRWYEALIKLADSLWARSNGNPLCISDDMRLAAAELGIQGNKDWMRDFQMSSQVRCEACGALKNPEFPVCGTCRSIDQNHPKAKDLKFAV